MKENISLWKKHVHIPKVTHFNKYSMWYLYCLRLHVMIKLLAAGADSPERHDQFVA